MAFLRPRQLVIQASLCISIVLVVLIAYHTGVVRGSISRLQLLPFNPLSGSHQDSEPQKPKYKPSPSYRPPPVSDPFPALATSTPPPIPAYNIPVKDAWKNYGFPIPPPLLIGFTRSWPMLLQTVVSYITAGWPPEQIYVVENTGVQRANAEGLLSLQHPWFLNHTALGQLGVHVVRTPVLLNFAQLQNFYLSLSHERGWPFYFWSHMDVLALNHEDGFENITPPAGETGYKTLYTLCLDELNRTLSTDQRWGLRFFAYDHLTLQNPLALEDIGGWDPLIPYYITDCDTYSRLSMRKWSQIDANCGIITDTSVVLDDLRALYRVPGVEPSFTDPNPPPLPIVERRKGGDGEMKETGAKDPIEYWRDLRRVADSMFHYKHGNRGRNTWQSGQRGGRGEPYYYDTTGFSEALDVLTEAGKEVFRRKWGHRDCDLIKGGGLAFEDQWQVLKDWD